MSEKSSGMESMAHGLLNDFQGLRTRFSPQAQEEILERARQFLSAYLAEVRIQRRTPTLSQTDAPSSPGCAVQVKCQNLTGTLVLECWPIARTEKPEPTSGQQETSQATAEYRRKIGLPDLGG